ncbi:MAG: peptide MFS transporter [Chitinophagales bacterium]|nr:peptide MFS transporter [Chitinophagales bacterium]
MSSHENLLDDNLNAGIKEEFFSDKVQGQPKQLYLLFFTEMWERFSFYGMRALLILFMVSQLKYADGKANLIYGGYNALVYLMPLLGGFLADRILGYRRAIILGGILMAIGHLVLAIPTENSFFVGMAFLISGNGFFKPNISTMVGKLYRPGDPRRDGGFSIFYMGINIGAAFGGLICGYIGQTINWHYGFGLAGIFMILGLIVFLLGQKSLGEIGIKPEVSVSKGNNNLLAQIGVVGLSLALVPLFIFLLHNYTLMGSIMIPFCIIATIGMIVLAFLQDAKTRDKMLTAIILIVFSAFFWAFYEQGGGSLNLFAARNVNMLGMSSAAINNFINPFYIILLGFPMAALWMYLSKIKKEPSTPLKFSISFLLLGIGFYIFVVGGMMAKNTGMVSLFYFAAGYFLITVGELCISPIGLSMTTKLSPSKFGGFMMGYWFLASAMGQFLAGWIGSLMALPTEGGQQTISSVESLSIYSGVFQKITLISLVFFVILALLSPQLKKWMHDVK